MMTFRQILDTAVITNQEHHMFVRICSDWEMFNGRISRFDKLKILKLMKYLVDERPKSKRLLDRTISRFNRLNALKKEDLF
ncbi:MAG: hypothetical protein GY820_16930 [Gammaproteobacteria bacterium]|nr:hypothetical protein [Gammaproteobacteria bacterium]